MAKDPVCGMYVDEKTAEFKIDVRGVTYYFCSSSISPDLALLSVN